MPSLNPFFILNESVRFPHARILRTTLWQKLCDTFFIFAGSFTKPEHVGIFDYLTLMIPYGFTQLAIWLFSSNNFFVRLSSVPFVLVSIVLAVVRYTTAISFTLFVSIIVGAIHAGSTIEGDRIKNKVLSMQLRDNYHTHSSTLGQYLNEKEVSIEDIHIHAKGSYKNLILAFNKRKNAKGKEVNAMVTLNLEKAKDKKTLDRLLALNIGRISRRLEKSKAPSYLFCSGNLYIISPQKMDKVNTKKRLRIKYALNELQPLIPSY
jgi:hypothetical protein